MRFAYADPPYPGLAKRYYGKEVSYAGEVDHAALIASLEYSGYDGWALSTSARALHHVLPLCPPDHRVCVWVKPLHPNPRTIGIHNTWEPLIVVRGRKRRPGRQDWLQAMPAKLGGSTLIGRKPAAFSVWMLELLGAQAGDSLVDVFPGSGNVAAAARALGLQT